MTVRLDESRTEDRAEGRRALLGDTINHVFSASLTVAAVISREALSAAATARLLDVIDELDRAASALRLGAADWPFERSLLDETAVLVA